MENSCALLLITINLIFTTPQEKIVKVKSSIENVLNQKSVTPIHLEKIAGQLSPTHLALGLIVRFFSRNIYDVESRFSWHETKTYKQANRRRTTLSSGIKPRT